jgi:hypothetical protein
MRTRSMSHHVRAVQIMGKPMKDEELIEIMKVVEIVLDRTI